MLGSIYAAQLGIFVMVSRIEIAKPDIVKSFAQGPRVLRAQAVGEIFNRNRAFWRLARSMSLDAFLRFLTEQTQLREVRFGFPNRAISGYTWGEVPVLETLLGLVERSYYSHSTAVRIHGLTEQIPKTVYLTRERAEPKNDGAAQPGPYDQDAIDRAFAQPPRVSQNEIELKAQEMRLVFLEGASQQELGILSGAVSWGAAQPLCLRYSTLERTLIDIVVRPFYAGGVSEVAKAFESARGSLSVDAMAAMLKRLSLGYPYHQAIGYYLERAGYKSTLVNLFAHLPMERDFYLAHRMGRTSYVPRWRLHVPEGF